MNELLVIISGSFKQLELEAQTNLLYETQFTNNYHRSNFSGFLEQDLSKNGSKMDGLANTMFEKHVFNFTTQPASKI